MHEIVTDVRGGCLSVCHAAQRGFTVQKWLNGLILFEVNTSGGPGNIVLYGSPDPSQQGGSRINFAHCGRPT